MTVSPTAIPVIVALGAHSARTAFPASSVPLVYIKQTESLARSAHRVPGPTVAEPRVPLACQGISRQVERVENVQTHWLSKAICEIDAQNALPAVALTRHGCRAGSACPEKSVTSNLGRVGNVRPARSLIQMRLGVPLGRLFASDAEVVSSVLMAMPAYRAPMGHRQPSQSVPAACRVQPTTIVARKMRSASSAPFRQSSHPLPRRRPVSTAVCAI